MNEVVINCELESPTYHEGNLLSDEDGGLWILGKQIEGRRSWLAIRLKDGETTLPYESAQDLVIWNKLSLITGHCTIYAAVKVVMDGSPAMAREAKQ